MGLPRMDAVMYCLSALKTFETLTPAEVRNVEFEIAMLGTRGLDVNDPAPKYTLRSLPGQFSGLNLVALMYVAAQQRVPGWMWGLIWRGSMRWRWGCIGAVERSGRVRGGGTEGRWGTPS